jgi:hypothetical protein
MSKQKTEFGTKDEVHVKYKSALYDIDCPAKITQRIREGGFGFKVKLSQKVGHDDKGGGVGSGYTMYVNAEHLTMVKKHEPKVLTGVTKKDWKVGDEFVIREEFSMDNDEDQEITGVVPEMVEMKGKTLKVVAIITKLGPTWLLDNEENYCWLPEWVSPIE